MNVLPAKPVAKQCPSCKAPLENNFQLNNDTVFNWMSCGNCKQPVFYTRCQCSNVICSKEKLYFGGKIECNACLKAYQLVPCPKCKKLNFWSGNYNMGAFINCYSCSNQYQHMACPFCKESNFWMVDKSQNLFYKFGLLVQCYHCKKKFQQMNCPHCRYNKYFLDLDYKQGILQKCNMCSNLYQHCNCPICGYAHFFKNTTFQFGEGMSCHECKSNFSISYCPKCKELNAKHSVYGIQNVSDFNCISCKSNYSVINCTICKSPNFSMNDQQDVCYDSSCSKCSKNIQIISCSKCKSTISCSCLGKKSYHTCSKCHTSYPKAKLKSQGPEFNPSNTNQGTGLMANNSKQEEKSNDEEADKMKCKICFSNNIDTLFEGCGHACCCFSCASDLKTKECPMCRKVSPIKKIFIG